MQETILEPVSMISKMIITNKKILSAAASLARLRKSSPDMVVFETLCDPESGIIHRAKWMEERIQSSYLEGGLKDAEFKSLIGRDPPPAHKRIAKRNRQERIKKLFILGGISREEYRALRREWPSAELVKKRNNFVRSVFGGFPRIGLSSADPKEDECTLQELIEKGGKEALAAGKKSMDALMRGFYRNIEGKAGNVKQRSGDNGGKKRSNTLRGAHKR